MRTDDSPLLRRTSALAAIAIITSGCPGLPSVRGVTAMSLSISAAPLAGPRAALDGESDLGPGTAAKAVVPSAGCEGIGGIACAAVAVVAVPIAAIVGAAAKTSQKLPLEQAEELNRVSADVASQLNLAASFRTALQAEAQRRGVTLNATNSDAEIIVAPLSPSWDISTGNRVAVRMEINVTLRRGSEQGSRQVTYRGPSAKVDDWIADNGQPIRQSLEEAMLGASRIVWDQILGAERGDT